MLCTDTMFTYRHSRALDSGEGDNDDVSGRGAIMLAHLFRVAFLKDFLSKHCRPCFRKPVHKNLF